MFHDLRSRLAGMVLLLIGLSLCVALPPTAPTRAAPGLIRHAALTPKGLGNCADWDNVCTLKVALTVAVSGDEIWVMKGVYYPGTTRDASFSLKDGVAIYGGFKGDETSRDQRNWQTNVTVLSGDIDHNDFTDANGVVTHASNIQGSNSYHVISNTNVTSSAILDGFVITAGQADGTTWPQRKGGGMYNDNSSPTLTNVTFSGNTGDYGGGMYNWIGSHPTLENVTFRGNTADYGGGMYNQESNPTLTLATFHDNWAIQGGGMYNSLCTNPTLRLVTFSDNAAQNEGGGMYNHASHPTLRHVTFSGNAAQKGGGMYSQSSNPTLTDVTFAGNRVGGGSSAGYGGGMFNRGGSPTLRDVVFHENTAGGSGVKGYGGGMYNENQSTPTLRDVVFNRNTAGGIGSEGYGGGMYNDGQSDANLANVVFSGNTAATGGGGMLNHQSHPTLVNVSFGGNMATAGYGMYNWSSHPTLTNTILWDHPTGELYNASSNPTFAYSDIRGCGGSGSWISACGTNGDHNLDADPRFVNVAGGNLRLQPTSPCIDKGNNAAIPPGVTTDLDGHPRISHGVVDMGAYEVPHLYLPIIRR